ncbi:hypothetical protein ACFXDJ_27280 [Streptomyces sp. NPDC059443]|uniref:hypothetical protein n=1 Tax=unclassified Streptomyces TaxID=2593676 RepID=UPI00367A4FDD
MSRMEGGLGRAEAPAEPPGKLREWTAVAPGAEMVAAAQFLLAGMAWITHLVARDYDGEVFGALAGLLCACVFAPPVVYVVGWLHTVLFTMPVMALSNAAGVRGRVRGPLFLFLFLLLFLLCAVYAVPLTWLFGAPYAATYAVAWGWLVAAGVLPVMLAACARKWAWPRAAIRKSTAAVAGLALPLVLSAGVGGYLEWVFPDDRPPVLERADLVGEWSGAGTRLVLGDDGSVKAVGLPVQHDSPRDTGACEGTGTWEAADVSKAAGRHRAGVALVVPGCGEAERGWEIRGTAAEPELFVYIGDMDEGYAVVLKRK